MKFKPSTRVQRRISISAFDTFERSADIGDGLFTFLGKESEPLLVIQAHELRAIFLRIGPHLINETLKTLKWHKARNK